MKLIQSTLLTISLLGITSACAENGGFLSQGFTGDTPMDQAWSMIKLYRNDDNHILQEFNLQGRLHLQSIYGEANDQSFNISEYKDAGNDETVWGNNIEARRARIGFKSKWFHHWKFDGNMSIDVDGMDNTGSDTFYKDLFDLYIIYAPSEAFNISAGKSKVKFTREQETSSNNILTLEYSLLSNALSPGELTGIWTSGKGIKGGWLYELGIYGNDRQREFTNGEGGEIVLAKIGYDYAGKVGLDSAVASIHYMTNNEPNFKSPNSPEYTTLRSPNFKTSIAISNDISHKGFGLLTDVMLASGNGVQSDVMGITLIPSYFIADSFQLVGRLHVNISEDSNGIRVPIRYDRLLSGDDEFGNTYTAAYIGLNYYIYGHKLKLMNGIEYSHLGGGEYEGITYMTGLRFSF